MARFRVALAIYVEADNQKDALQIVDDALFDALFDFDDRLKSRHMLWVEDAPNADDDEDEEYDEDD